MRERVTAIATELGVLRELDALRLLSIETVRGRVITFIVELPGRACSPLPPVDGREVDEHEVGDHVRLLREAVALDDIAMTRQDSEEMTV